MLAISHLCHLPCINTCLDDTAIMITEDEDDSAEFVRVRDMIIGDIYDV
jgi:hypothetical protein